MTSGPVGQTRGMTAPATPGALAGVRILDLTSVVMGPYATQILGDLGAEVISVEEAGGDTNRIMGPGPEPGLTGVAMNLLRNKRNVCLDLKHPGGRDAFLRIAATCDVFVQNFRGGVIERLGFGYDAVRAANPRLVYCAISGFGETGPLSKAGCADPIMQAFSGFARANGAPGDPVEAFRFTGFLDLTTASVATMSTVPSARPSCSASTSRTVRSGGFTL